MSEMSVEKIREKEDECKFCEFGRLQRKRKGHAYPSMSAVPFNGDAGNECQKTEHDHGKYENGQNLFNNFYAHTRKQKKSRKRSGDAHELALYKIKRIAEHALGVILRAYEKRKNTESAQKDDACYKSGIAFSVRRNGLVGEEKIITHRVPPPQ